MCNKCECENSDKCSIVGYMPLIFCCEKCLHYESRETCLNSMVERNRILRNLKTGSKFPKALSVKAKEEAKEREIEVQQK